MHFFAKMFGHIKKKQYLCTRFPKIERSGSPKISNFWGERSTERSATTRVHPKSREF